MSDPLVVSARGREPDLSEAPEEAPSRIVSPKNRHAGSRMQTETKDFDSYSTVGFNLRNASPPEAAAAAAPLGASAC